MDKRIRRAAFVRRRRENNEKEGENEMSKVNSRWWLCTSALAGSLSLGFWANPALAQSQTYANEAAARTESDALETIVVTAEKRQETSLNVPMGLTALSGQQLERTQSFRMEDFVGTVPGLTLIEGVGGGSQLVVRGVTAGAADVNTGVAVYVDDTPLTPSSTFAIPTVAAPNLDAFDMTRIEVLKGPQGTLYGANALGGILKYVTNAPDPDRKSVV